MEIEEELVEFKAKIHAARARSERYNLLDKALTSDADLPAAAPSKFAAVSRLLREENGILVGIDGPTKELEKHLKEGQKKRKVVSVLGVGGHGKTTLAKEVYRKLSWQFDCHAFVTAGPNAVTAALMDLLLQVNPQMDGQDSRFFLNEQELISQLWEFLQNKRYFVFIDDIRNTHDWSVMNCALPNNDLGSRILTTTRVKDVATLCSIRPSDVTYEMKGLDDAHSRSLLLSMIPARAEDRSADFEKYCHDMLKLCCGLQLAIIVSAGLVAVKSADSGPLGKLEASSLSMLDPCSTSDGMRIVLDICFADLSPHLKTCFLYLSTFPENHSIKKDRLIWRWIVEGFIPITGQESMWEKGESYFNELICRNLIQPVFDDYNDDHAVVCTVHPVIHDFIASLSRQEGIHTTAAELISGPFPCGTIRRFSVDCRNQEKNEADTLESRFIHLSRVRSLTVFGDTGRAPDLSAFKHLRVLDLEDNKTLDDYQLGRIGFLFLLKYLGLGGTNVTKLPQQIMSLKHLAALDLRRTEVKELPSVGTELVSVLANGVMIPGGIREMEQLEELSTVSLLPDDAAGLVNKSIRLRMLEVTFGYAYLPTKTNLQGVKRLLEEVEKSNLHTFFLDDYPCDAVGLLVEYWANKRPQYLRKFELRVSDYLRVMPQKMASLVALTHLHIRVSELEAQVVCALGKLPNLLLLNLFSRRGTQGRLPISSKDGFRCLKMFCFSCSAFLGMGLQFKEGAMPHMRRLQIDFSAKETKSAYGDFDFGIQHLYCLVQVRAIIRCKRATVSEAEDAEASIRSQVSQIKNADRSSTPSVEIRVSIFPESSSLQPIPGLIPCVMEDAMVSASFGAMNSVLTKLAFMMGERCAELTGTDEQELILRDELQLMNALLKQLSHTPDLNIQMKGCRNEMRELAYDIDDSIDDLMVRSVNEKGSSGSAEKRAVPHDFVDQIQKLNAQVEEADLRSMVRKTELHPLVPTYMVSRERWLCKVYDEGNYLVGMNGLQEIVRMLMDDRQDNLHGVCICGAAGMGKTTLATHVYNQIRSQFSLCMFMSIDQNTDFSKNHIIKRLCRSILQQLEGYASIKENPIGMVKKALSCERFLIVIDGVSSAQILEVVQFLPLQNCGRSRIITTTHIKHVAELCGKHLSSFIYTMKPLTPHESLSLFQSMIFGPRRSCLSLLKEVREQIVEACHGIPLAITLTAGLLVRKPIEMSYWDTVEKHMKLIEGDHLSVEWIRKLCDICYSDLPDDMKTCLLYLACFPANDVILKDKLIRRWAAEGFLPKEARDLGGKRGELLFRAYRQETG